MGSSISDNVHTRTSEPQEIAFLDKEVSIGKLLDLLAIVGIVLLMLTPFFTLIGCYLVKSRKHKAKLELEQESSHKEWL